MKRFFLTTAILVFALSFFASCKKIQDERFLRGNIILSATGQSYPIECRISPKGRLQVNLEQYCTILDLPHEMCHRCGHTEITVGKERIAVLWEAPYVDYLNRTGSVKLKERSIYKEGKVFTCPEFLQKTGLAKVKVRAEKACVTVTYKK